MNKLPGSFRDPAGFLFEKEGVLYRQINDVYRADYELLISSGLYAELLKQKLIIPHIEADIPFPEKNGFRIIRPERVPLVSYPYEWCFSQLKAAALLTIKIQQLALAHGMSLKDASAYNVQFYKGAPVFIDTLSFRKHVEGSPWAAYQQFCRHFLAPLVLMAKTDLRLSCLGREFIDGVPLDLASTLLPAGTYLDFSVLTHIHLHAKTIRRYETPGKTAPKQPRMSMFSLRALLNSLESAISRQALPSVKTEWGDYYSDTNYGEAAFEEKKRIVSAFISEANPAKLWDLGANTGEFSRLASRNKIFTAAFDVDPIAVERNYVKAAKDYEEHLLPLLLDLTNPSPAIGWANGERESLAERAPADCVMALALIHHLAIGNNLPFGSIFRYFSELAPYLIIEFVPKEDSKTQILLSSRRDIFPDYHQPGFEAAFTEYFTVLRQEKITGSGRTLYLMRKKTA